MKTLGAPVDYFRRLVAFRRECDLTALIEISPDDLEILLDAYEEREKVAAYEVHEDVIPRADVERFYSQDAVLLVDAVEPVAVPCNVNLSVNKGETIKQAIERFKCELDEQHVAGRFGHSSIQDFAKAQADAIKSVCGTLDEDRRKA